MTTISAIARKELRTYFLSPIALIFIATFLLASLFSFFWVEGFFSRGVADTRPLFEWLPVLLIFLVPALGMRLWSEEERTGTMELLRTFPLPVHAMVLGKFLSGLSLVAVSLALTFPIPVTVSLLGDLDWGPVFGGYLATLLLAGAYLAITLCVSAATSSQIVALVFGSVACGALYLVGADPVVTFFGNRAAEILRSVGAGSRFDSILRGVVDLRDLTYYASLIGFFLLVNITLLTARRWSQSPARAGFRFNRRLTLGLVALNLVALNVVLAPVRATRLDLTEHREYSISPVTENLLDNLKEPLLLRGYFSGKTHPLLAPLVPRIRDMLDEYGAIGGDRVRAEFVDPTSDPELEKEANQSYGIKSVPFQFADRHESSVVNSYFHVLVRYGDQYETLSFDDLIEVQVNGMDLNVRLRNLEYDLTRTIQKVVYGFVSVESVMARLPENAKFTTIITEEALPPGFEGVAGHVRKVAQELADRSNGRFTFEIIDPDVPGASMNRQQVMESFGIRPMALSLFSEDSFFLSMILQVGERTEQIIPAESLTEADIREELLAALKRAGPGALKTLGVFEGTQGHGQGALSFRRLKEYLSQTYSVESVDLKDGRVPGNVDVLLVLDPRDLDNHQVYALDQFLMRGGSALIATGPKALDPSQRQRLSLTQTESGLTQFFKRYGIEVGSDVVLDPVSGAFPIPVTRNLGGFVVQEMQMLRYPAFVNVRGEGLSSDNPAVAGLPGVVLHWPTEVKLVEPELPSNASSKDAGQKQEGDAAAPSPRGLQGEGAVLLASSPDAWVLDDFSPEPDFGQNPELGWPVRGEQKTRPLAVTRMGPFTSFYADREPPVLGGGAGREDDHGHDHAHGHDDEEVPAGEGRRGNVIATSPAHSRLVVIGSPNFASDFAVDLGRQFSDAYLANLQLVQNLVDWCLEDVELLKIRSRGTFARLLAPTDTGVRKFYEWGNYLFALIAVGAIGLGSINRRKNTKPFPLPPRGKGAAENTSSAELERDAEEGAA